MDYGDSVQKVLLRKIQKAEQDLMQLKLDYCRFIFGLNHRSKVVSNGVTYQVRSVEVDSMTRNEDGSFGKPEVSGVVDGSEGTGKVTSLGKDWELTAVDSPVGAGH
ncbi:hypothetical protein [Marinobacter sp. CHS3-4]|uniref:hypothetical protein n=1 Tax=Marinobacter sp. CHS3-4 TaxID=3045174 RepID=UPI0024B59E12|nr:hypothetical protein [Marinobacter sp. CHS3-4]MDI9245414.1 hypothetical protein [Marinobacter sp. CHS3-4]